MRLPFFFLFFFALFVHHIIMVMSFSVMQHFFVVVCLYHSRSASQHFLCVYVYILVEIWISTNSLLNIYLHFSLSDYPLLEIINLPYIKSWHCPDWIFSWFCFGYGVFLNITQPQYQTFQTAAHRLKFYFPKHYTSRCPQFKICSSCISSNLRFHCHWLKLTGLVTCQAINSNESSRTGNADKVSMVACHHCWKECFVSLKEQRISWLSSHLIDE